MNATRLLLVLAVLVFINQNLAAQQCELWTEPVALSDSMEDNRNPFLVRINDGGNAYYVFWERTLDVFGSEIVYMDYYNIGAPESVLLAEGFMVTNPQVISMANWYPQTDTLAFIFYQTDQAGNEDIYYVVMTSIGFTDPLPFAVTAEDEMHLRVSPGGAMVWQEGDAIRFTRLRHEGSSFYFEPVITIDEGACHNPDIHKTDLYNPEQFIAWEKGNTDEPEIWHREWDYENDDWGDPLLLFPSGDLHYNIRFSRGMEWSSWNAILLSDYRDSEMQYHIHGHDFVNQGDFVSEFTQAIPFQPDLFTIDLITQDFWISGYFSFRHDEGLGNYDIYSSDYGEISPSWEYYYCRIDSTATSEYNPVLFEGVWGFSYFDLICIWGSYRNGHSQLFTSKTQVVIGSVPEPENKSGHNIRAYPNPCSDQTIIEYELKSSVNCRISIFNHLGQEIEVLPAGSQDAGMHQMTWDAGQYPAGLYHFRLSSDGEQRTGIGKILVVR